MVTPVQPPGLVNAIGGIGMEHWFWLLLTVAVLVWYSTVTIYVAVCGVRDIRSMLQRLRGSGASTPQNKDAVGVE